MFLFCFVLDFLLGFGGTQVAAALYAHRACIWKGVPVRSVHAHALTVRLIATGLLCFNVAVTVAGRGSKEARAAVHFNVSKEGNASEGCPRYCWQDADNWRGIPMGCARAYCGSEYCCV